jgi:3D (Asp-Asp-Asp) domain-containing protein
MVLSRSLTRKLAATCGAMLGFVLLYEVTALDSKATSAHEVEVRETAWPRPGARLRFHATAYCKGTTTASGTTVRTGIAAADPVLLPVGSVIQIESLSPRYNGIYTVMDTGPAVQGREIDIYMWNCNEALAFGRRSIAINVLRLGWNPKASAPAAIAANIIAKPDAAAPGYPAGYGPAATAAAARTAGTPAAPTTAAAPAAAPATPAAATPAPAAAAAVPVPASGLDATPR